jgi:hypothetical protein
MLSKMTKAAVLGSALVASVAAVATVASSAAVGDGAKAVYAPRQSISHDLGSKSAIGYFVREAGACQVVLMIAENVDPEVRPMPSAARLRLALRPGQSAGLDSEEGRSIDLTCGDEGATLTVFSGHIADPAVVMN